MESTLKKILFLLALTFVESAAANGYHAEPGHGASRKFYKLGEFNDKCRSARDCRHFGYVCRENRTCQCDFMYIPDVDERTCVGGVNQRCVYDEHCIDGAYCMNQAICKCKETSPVELDDGLVCTDGQENIKSPLPFYSLLFVVVNIL